jgi:hypothetical protein
VGDETEERENKFCIGVGAGIGIGLNGFRKRFCMTCWSGWEERRLDLIS